MVRIEPPGRPADGGPILLDVTGIDPADPPALPDRPPWRRRFMGALLAAPGRLGADYRPDIDGLRAVAVLSVILYHLHAPLVTGGFVGVDIFFVISGYLITRNIWGELQAGTFSIRAFYLRRIRRIVPAFAVMAAVTLVAGCLLLLPADLKRLGASTAWAAVSASNVYFWRYLDIGYFADSSEQQPMLHTWSLGVEEQFYLLWPAVLLVVALLPRSGRAAALGTLALIGVSLAIGELTLERSPKFAYFMLPARFGELMVGALLVFSSRLHERLRGAREAIAVGGLALLVYALTQLDAASPFPGVNALYPSFGAGLVILAGGLGSRLVRALLTPRPMVFVGLISYSLYLWHWPILAYLKYFYTTLEPIQVALAVPLMFVLATLSYRFVELPARQWRPRPRIQVTRLFLLPAGLLVVTSAIVVASDGLRPVIEADPTFAAAVERAQVAIRPPLSYPSDCQLGSFEADVLRQDRCVIRPAGAPAGEPDILLWGDSHAAAYIGVLGGIGEHAAIAFRNASFSTCPPVFGGTWGAAQYRGGCTSFRDLVQEAIAGGAFRTVFIGSAWGNDDADPGFRAALESSVAAMTDAGLSVVILGQAPTFERYDRDCVIRTLRLPVVDCVARATTIDPGEPPINGYLAALAASQPGVSFLSIHDLVCRDGSCSPFLDGQPIYYDSGHLSMEGSWRLGRLLAASPAGAAWLDAMAGVKDAGE
jgi:peptidoglycan/LPS O-acetylase OafA/YrhL